MMAQISCRVDELVKKDAEKALKSMGLTLSGAINIFLAKVANEKRIPFEVSANPFYSKQNMDYLEQKMANYKAGKLNLAEHELIQE